MSDLNLAADASARADGDQTAVAPDAVAATYERDLHAWAAEQAALLRARRLDEIDVEHIAEEIEGLGSSQRAELVGQLAVMVMHLLKWEFQPERRSRSWELTIRDQRDEIVEHLGENLSLRAYQDEALVKAYRKALRRAAHETDLPQDYFPWACKYSFEQLLDENFWPDQA